MNTNRTNNGCSCTPNASIKCSVTSCAHHCKDVDHCGLLDLFPATWLTQKSLDSLLAERTVQGGFRERNPLHAPYARICKLLTHYHSPDPTRLKVLGGSSEPLTELLARIGDFSFGPMAFEVWEGAGGHLPGELILVDRAHRVAFTGDVYVNLKELTREQAAYNRYAPYLMTSVDTDPRLAAREREALMDLLGSGTWTVFGGHGPAKVFQL